MLTDIQCRKARPRDRDYKLADSKGLYLFVTTTGYRSWRMKYRDAAKREKRLTFGPYPEISLEAARSLRDKAREQLRARLDPAVVRKQEAAEAEQAAETTFKAVALMWHKARSTPAKPGQPARLKPRYAGQILQRLERHCLPSIGAIPIQDVTPALVLKVIRAIEDRGAHDIAHRVRQYISDIFLFAIASGWAEGDPAHVVQRALVPRTRRLRPAVVRIEQARNVLKVTEARRVYAVTKLSARLLALTAARPGVVRLAETAEFEGLDGPAPIWRIPAHKMKLTAEQAIDVTYEFVIPLPRQAVDVVKCALDLAGPQSRLLFPAIRNPHLPLSDSTLSAFFRDAGLRGMHVPHGWRASFSTIMNERAAELDRPADRDIIDMMLAHMQEGVEPIYNRAAYMKRRREIAQDWADCLMLGAPQPQALIEDQRGMSARSQRRRARERAACRRTDGELCRPAETHTPDGATRSPKQPPRRRA